MRGLLIALIILFYIFFFLRAFFLSKSLGKNIKPKNMLIYISIGFSSISTMIFLLYLIFPHIGAFLFIIFYSDILAVIGTITISIGLIFTVISSLSLGKSWRIGSDKNKKTDLVTTGIYRYSRNPYFLSFDLVLIGMTLYLLSPILIFTALITILLFHFQILQEEKYLESKHQENYRKYKKETRRYM